MGFLARLFGAGDGKESVPADSLVQPMVERVLALYTRLRLAPGCEKQLARAMAPALVHIRSLVAGDPRTHEANAAAWSDDHYMRAYFAAASDIGPALARSRALRTFFDEHPGADSAYAVMGMAMAERTSLGVALVGDQTRSDVRQTTLGFSDHHIRLCAADEDSLREEVTRRMVEQIAIEGLAKVAQYTSLREDLEQERSLLAARLRLLERDGTGLKGVISADDGAADETDPGELARVRTQAEENEQKLAALGPRSEILTRQLGTMCESFENAAELLQMSVVERRVDRMNIVVQDGVGDASQSQVLRLHVARVPGNPPQQRALAILHVKRADMPRGPEANLLDRAEQLL